MTYDIFSLLFFFFILSVFVLVLLSAHIEIFSDSRVHDFVNQCHFYSSVLLPLLVLFISLGIFWFSSEQGEGYVQYFHISQILVIRK